MLPSERLPHYVNVMGLCTSFWWFCDNYFPFKEGKDNDYSNHNKDDNHTTLHI